MYHIIFSIPIHEKFEVVVDQICNIKHFNKNCGIVLHISKSFDYKESQISREQFEFIVKRIGDVWINPVSLRSGRSDIIQTYISNFEYIKSLVDFEYFAFCASNESFIKPGTYEYIRKFDWGSKNIVISSPEDWKFGKDLFQDSDLMGYLNSQTAQFVFSNAEGQFYKKEIFEQISLRITSFFDYKKIEVFYPREEVYFSTIAACLTKTSRNPIGQIFTYSAYHFRFLWDVTRFEINKILKTNNNFFSVKRVDRKFNDNIRVLLRQKFGYGHELEGYIGEFIKQKSMSKFEIDKISLNKNSKQLLNNWKKMPKFFMNKWK